MAAWDRKLLYLLAPLAFFALCLGPVPFEIDQGADAGRYRQRDQDIHRRFVVSRKESDHLPAISPAQKGHGKETQCAPRRQRGQKLPARIVHDPRSRQNRSERKWRR
jgi:hypothetical protein